MRNLIWVVGLIVVVVGCKKNSDDDRPHTPMTATAETREFAVAIHLTYVPPSGDITIEGIDTQKLRTERGGSINVPTLDIDVDWSAIPATAQELTVVITERMSPTKSNTSKATVKLERPLTMTLVEKTSDGAKGASCNATGLVAPRNPLLDRFYPSLEATGEVVFDLVVPVAGKLEIDGKTQDATPGKPITIRHNIVVATLDKAVADEAPIPVVRATLTVGGRSSTASVSCTVALATVFAGVDRPLLAPGEEATGAPIAMLSSAGKASTFGKATKNRDYHLIAQGSKLPDLERSCGTYVNKATGTTTTMMNRATRFEVRVKDRRSGKEVAKKEFSGRIPPCASKVTGGVGDVDVYNEAEVDKWLASLIKT